MFGIKFTPESFIMIPLALGLDLAGIILVCFGLDDFGMTDMIGIVTIDLWLIIRNKKQKNQQGGKGVINNLRKLFTGDLTKIAAPTFGELIPYVGALPFWTLSVLFNLTDTE